MIAHNALMLNTNCPTKIAMLPSVMNDEVSWSDVYSEAKSTASGHRQLHLPCSDEYLGPVHTQRCGQSPHLLRPSRCGVSF